MILLLLTRALFSAGAEVPEIGSRIRDGGSLRGERNVSPEPDDDELIRRAQADPRAFGPLYERYHDRIYRYCYARLGNKDVAEDVTAETFLKALANLRRLRPGSVLLAWLYTLARHAVADYYARRRRTEPLPDTEEAAPRSGPESSAGTRPAARTESELDRVALAQAMAQLPEQQRAVLELQLAGWSGAESAAALGKTEAAVKMMRYRAIERLQQLLVDR